MKLVFEKKKMWVFLFISRKNVLVGKLYVEDLVYSRIILNRKEKKRKKTLNFANKRTCLIKKIFRTT